MRNLIATPLVVAFIPSQIRQAKRILTWPPAGIISSTKFWLQSSLTATGQNHHQDANIFPQVIGSCEDEKPTHVTLARYNISTINLDDIIYSSSSSLNATIIKYSPNVDFACQNMVSPAPESLKVIHTFVQKLGSRFMEFENVSNISTLNLNMKNKQMASFLDEATLDLETLARLLLKPGCSFHLNIQQSDCDNNEAFGSSMPLILEMSINVSVQDTLVHNDGEQVDPEEQCTGSLLMINSRDGLLDSLTEYHCPSHLQQQGKLMQLYHSKTTLELSHMALNHAITASESNEDHDSMLAFKEQMNLIVSQVERRIALTMGSDLRGRTAADAAFNFALAGVSNHHSDETIQSCDLLYDSLASMATHELCRVGARSSFQSKYILQIIEKFAASGLSCYNSKSSKQHAMNLYRSAGLLLQQKQFDNEALIQSLLQGTFDLFSDRPLLWLWRHSTRMKKQVPATSQLQSVSKKEKCIKYGNNYWESIFTDPSKDLVVDIGSGMGVSLLGLACFNATTEASADCSSSLLSDEHLINMREKGNSRRDNPLANIQWESCNFCGSDLNQLLVQYANGIASRRVRPTEDGYEYLRDCIHFFTLPAEEFVDLLMSYPGNVVLASINFPSPYRLRVPQKGETHGNSQLPATISGKDGFMVTENLLLKLSKLLSRHDNSSRNGKLLLQTKCEDVAIFMKNLSLNTSCWEVIPCPNPVANVTLSYYNGRGIPRRTEEWISSSHTNMNIIERAEGIYWSSTSLLPSCGKTETEAACIDDGSVIHRCLLQERKKS